MNLRVIAKTIGILLILVSAAMLACSAFGALIEWEHWRTDANALKYSAAITATVAIILLILGRKAKASTIFRRESIAIVAFSWLLIAFFGALPFFMSSANLSFVDSFFESASGFTTTGASTMTNIEACGKLILLWRSLIQWFGGVGFLALFVALLSFTGQGSLNLFQHESSAQREQSAYHSVRQTAGTLWLVYLIYTSTCALGLRFFGMSTFDAICHSFTTMSTGGFSTKNASISHFVDLRIHVWICLFMILGSINFLRIAALFKKNATREILLKRVLFFFLDPVTRYFLLLYLAVSILIFVDISRLATIFNGRAIIDAFFQVASIISTTGFCSTDFDLWPLFSKLLLLALMFVGGCAGSTAGGLKFDRIYTAIIVMIAEMKRYFRPNLILREHKRRGDIISVKKSAQNKLDILLLICVATACVLLGAPTLALLEPQLSMSGAFSAVVASLFNIGPGFAEFGATKNFAHIGSLSKLILSLLMIAGRLEFMSFLVIFLPSFWRKY